MENVTEITPSHLQCGLGACPAIFESENGTYIIIGKKVNRKLPEVERKCAEDEYIVEIPKDLIDKLKIK